MSSLATSPSSTDAVNHVNDKHIDRIYQHLLPTEVNRLHVKYLVTCFVNNNNDKLTKSAIAQSLSDMSLYSDVKGTQHVSLMISSWNNKLRKLQQASNVDILPCTDRTCIQPNKIHRVCTQRHGTGSRTQVFWLRDNIYNVTGVPDLTNIPDILSNLPDIPIPIPDIQRKRKRALNMDATESSSKMSKSGDIDSTFSKMPDMFDFGEDFQNVWTQFTCPTTTTFTTSTYSDDDMLFPPFDSPHVYNNSPFDTCLFNVFNASSYTPLFNISPTDLDILDIWDIWDFLDNFV